MKAADALAVARDLAATTKEFVARAVEPFTQRLAAIEHRIASVKDGDPGERGERGEPGQSIVGPEGPPGKDADPEIVKALVLEAIPVPKDGRDGVDGAPGKDADPEHVKALVAEAVKAIPAPKDGRDGANGKDAVGEQGQIGPMGPRGPEGAPGRDADPARIEQLEAEVKTLGSQLMEANALIERHASIDMKALIVQAVADSLALWQRPANGKDGTSVTVDDVAPLVAAEVAKAVASIPVPKDGVGLTGAVQDRDGNLVLTLSDGTAKNVGSVVGRDADMDALTKHVDGVLASWPRPKDGKDGADGVGFDDIEEDLEDDGRVLVRRHRSSDGRVKEIKHVTGWEIPRGTWKPEGWKLDGSGYMRGDTVTWSGSRWTALKSTTAKPGESRDWYQSVMRGKPGERGQKGEIGARGDAGPQGPPGQRYT